MPKIDLSTYCPLPFNGYDSRLKWVCCVYQEPTDQNLKSHSEIKNSPKIIQLQQDLLNGIKSPECQSCWGNESSGSHSLRTLTLRKLNSGQVDFDKLARQTIDHKKLRYLWIDSGSVCNLACRSCSYIYSTSLFKEYKDRHNYTPITGIKKTDVQSLMQEDYSSIAEIMVLGGEPFLNLDHIQIIDQVVKQGHSKNAELKYFTNGTVRLPHAIERQISHFKKVKFNLSIDAVDQQFEYIRTNGQWDSIQSNLNYLLELQKLHPNIILSVQITISVLNVLYLGELMQWLDNFKFESIIQWPVSDPEEYTFNILTEQQKAHVAQYLDSLSYDFSSIAAHVVNTPFNPDSLAKFHQETAWTEKYKKMALQDYLPRLVNLLKM
jgi:MoaA/NifB/PqqE/SkfB family radical SAM enzyme